MNEQEAAENQRQAAKFGTNYKHLQQGIETHLQKFEGITSTFDPLRTDWKRRVASSILKVQNAKKHQKKSKMFHIEMQAHVIWVKDRDKAQHPSSAPLGSQGYCFGDYKAALEYVTSAIDATWGPLPHSN